MPTLRRCDLEDVTGETSETQSRALSCVSELFHALKRVDLIQNRRAFEVALFYTNFDCGVLVCTIYLLVNQTNIKAAVEPDLSSHASQTVEYAP
jgi:hypothetical protein